MAINIIDMIQDQLGDAVMAQAGNFLGLGESNPGVKSAMGAAIPTILGSLISKGATPSGASGILDMLTKGNHDGSIFDNLGSVLGGGNATSSLVNSGGSIVKSLLGNNMGSVVDMIAKVSGLKQGASSSLMSLAAPMVMGMLGKYVKNKALDAIGLSKFLGTQSRNVASALPAGMGSLLGLGSGNIEKAAATVSNAVEDTAGAGKSMLSRLLPLAVIALLGIGAYSWWSGTSATDVVGDAAGAVTDVAGAAANVAGDAAGAAADMAGDAAGAVGDAAGAVGEVAGDAAGAVGDAAGAVVNAATAAATKALEGVKFATGSVGEKFSNFLSSGKEGDEAFAFNNLNFTVGSSTIDAASLTEVDNLAKVLAAFKTVNIEVGGHTDNTGNAATNEKLSQERADSVKDRLIKQGIDGSRISTVGYGSKNPIADNATTEGKKKNRRIEVKVTKR